MARLLIGFCIFVLANLVEISSAESLPPPLILAFDENEEPLPAEPDSDLILRGVGSLKLVCLAPYPVKWTYSGNGDSRMETETSTPSMYEYKAEAKIENVDEHQTGAYLCSNPEDPSVRTFYYIYVPGPSVLVPTSGKTIEINSDRFLIPCSPSSPEINLKLEKISGPALAREPSFDPRIGFIIQVDDQRDGQGAYKCIAQDEYGTRTLEYHAKVLPSPELITLNSRPNNTLAYPPCDPPCLDTAKCIFLSQYSTSTCQCLQPLTGDGYTHCGLPVDTLDAIPPPPPPPAQLRARIGDGSPLPSECIGHGDCPEHLSCFTDNSCRDPCRETVQGVSCTQTYGSCTVVNHYPRCDCPPGTSADRREGCVGLPQDDEPMQEDEQVEVPPPPAPIRDRDGPCQKHTDCPNEQSCFVDRVCRNPCIDATPGLKCGRDAVCKTIDHTAVCSCPGGYTGDPLRACYPQ